MTETAIQEAREFLRRESERAKTRGEEVPTSGPDFERAVKSAARSITELQAAARLATRSR